MASMALDRRWLAAPGESRGISRLRAVAFLHIFWLALLAAAGAWDPLAQIDGQHLLYPACVVFTISFLWSLGSWRLLRGTVFDPYGLFLIAAGLFNGGQGFLEIVGWNSTAMLDGRFSPNTLVRSLYLVTLSLMSLQAGALAALAQRTAAGAGASGLVADSRRATRLTGMILVAIAIVPSFFLFQDFLAIVMEYGYAEMYRQGNIVGSIWALSGFLAPGLIFWLAGSRDERGGRRLCLAATALFVLLHLFLGERAAAVICAVPIAWLIERQGRRIPRSLMAAVAVIALLGFAAVKQTRDTAGWSRLSWDQQITALANLQNPISNSIAEMGQTMVVVAHTISLVPASRDFDFGVSYLYGASSVVPNVGWDIHPSVSHGLLCDWITRTVEPILAAAGGGLGYSFIAEAYLNFGWAGGPLFIGLFGYALCRLFRQGDSPDPSRQALAASFLSMILVFTRGESAIVARGVVWYSVAPYILARVLTARSVRRRVKQTRWIY